MNFTGVKYFLTIVEEGNISAAARTLFISQQALSEQLKRLECEIGTPLIHRSPFRLTEAGECFYEGCKKLTSVYNDMLTEIGRVIQNRRKKITIAVPTYCTHPYLLDFLGYFQSKYSEYEIEVIKRQHTDIARNMNGVDLYLSYLPLSPDLDNHILLESDPYCVTFQRALAERVYDKQWKTIEEQLIQTQNLSLLRNMPFILLRDRYGQVTQDLRAIFFEYRFEPIVGFNSENYELNHQTCYNGLGCLLAARSIIRRSLFSNQNLNTEELLSYPIKVTSFETKMAIGSEKGRQLNPAQQRFIEEFCDFMKKQ